MIATSGVDNYRPHIERLRAAGWGTRRIAKELELDRSAVRRALERWGTSGSAPKSARLGAEQVGISITGDMAVVTLPPGARLGDIEAILRERGIEPAEWIIERVTANEWEALAGGGDEPKIVTLHQLKVALRHRSGVILPASEVAERYHPVPAPEPKWDRPLLAVVCGDQHAPYEDPDLHVAFLRWLTDVTPDIGVLAGDTMDLPAISRHRDRIHWNAGTQQCVDGGYRVISDYRDASPETRWRKIPGNHDDRLVKEIMDRAERMAFIAPAARPGEPEEPHLYSIRRLLHLDSLGVELIGTEGEDWRYAEAVIAPGLVVRHEPPSVAKMLRLNRSVMAGHTHRQSVRCVTMFDEQDSPVVRSVVEVGCMTRTREGLGYTDHPDWAAGFGTAAIYPDGTIHFDLATWRNGALTWRGERWGGLRQVAA